MSGIWVEESFYECGEYLTQKPRKNKIIKSCLQREKKFCFVEIGKKHEESFLTPFRSCWMLHFIQ